jgi:hypothetical protein
VRSRLATVAASLVTLIGCTSGGPGGTLALSWRFADGRDCLDAGATRIELRLAPPQSQDTPRATFTCGEGLLPALVMTGALPGSGTLYVDARSGPGGDLYRGTLGLDSAPFASHATATVTLYAVAAN